MREAIAGGGAPRLHHARPEPDRGRLPARERAPRAGCWRRCGFKYEGVAQSYLQINGRWRNHVLYASLRSDRRGRTDAG